MWEGRAPYGQASIFGLCGAPVEEVGQTHAVCMALAGCRRQRASCFRGQDAAVEHLKKSPLTFWGQTLGTEDKV